MAEHGKSIKGDDKYEAWQREGRSKIRAARIANSGKSSSRKGGNHSRSKKK